MTPTERKNAFATWPLAHIHRELFSKPKKDCFKNATEEDFQALQARCEAHWVQKVVRWAFEFFLPVFTLALIGFAAAVITTFFLNHYGDRSGDYNKDFTLAGIAILLSMSILIMSVPFFDFVLRVTRQDGAYRLLLPLKLIGSSVECCGPALDLTKVSQSAKAYCDQVLQTGRELRAVDLTVMKLLADGDASVRRALPRDVV